MIVSLLFNFCG